MRKGKENKPNKISLTNFGYFFNFLEFKQVKSKRKLKLPLICTKPHGTSYSSHFYPSLSLTLLQVGPAFLLPSFTALGQAAE